MAADATSVVSVLGALGAGGVGLLQWLYKRQQDQIDREREQRTKEREAEQGRREAEAERERKRIEQEAAEERAAISKRFTQMAEEIKELKERGSVHDMNDVRHDQALGHQSELLVEIRDELREMRRALLERPGSSPGGRR